jgi:hypothetical protein
MARYKAIDTNPRFLAVDLTAEKGDQKKGTLPFCQGIEIAKKGWRPLYRAVDFTTLARLQP